MRSRGGSQCDHIGCDLGRSLLTGAPGHRHRCSGSSQFWPTSLWNHPVFNGTHSAMPRSGMYSANGTGCRLMYCAPGPGRRRPEDAGVAAVVRPRAVQDRADQHRRADRPHRAVDLGGGRPVDERVDVGGVLRPDHQIAAAAPCRPGSARPARSVCATWLSSTCRARSSNASPRSGTLPWTTRDLQRSRSDRRGRPGPSSARPAPRSGSADRDRRRRSTPARGRAACRRDAPTAATARRRSAPPRRSPAARRRAR